MKKPNYLEEEVLSCVKDESVSHTNFQRLMNQSFDYLDGKENTLVKIKKTIQGEADDMFKRSMFLIKFPEDYIQSDLEEEKRNTLKSDAIVIGLNKRFKSITGYSCADFFKYSKFSNLICRKIRELEINRGYKA